MRVLGVERGAGGLSRRDGGLVVGGYPCNFGYFYFLVLLWIGLGWAWSLGVSLLVPEWTELRMNGMVCVLLTVRSPAMLYGLLVVKWCTSVELRHGMCEEAMRRRLMGDGIIVNC